MKKIVGIWFLLCISTVSLLAQASESSTDIAAFSADIRLKHLAEKQAKINALSAYKNSSGFYKGYRIMILNTNNRELAYKTRAELLNFFPGNSVYLAYQAPFFKIKAGDFIKRDEADKVKKDLAKYFKQPLYVVSDLIRVSPEEEARLIDEEQRR